MEVGVHRVDFLEDIVEDREGARGRLRLWSAFGPVTPILLSLSIVRHALFFPRGFQIQCDRAAAAGPRV